MKRLSLTKYKTWIALFVLAIAPVCLCVNTTFAGLAPRPQEVRNLVAFTRLYGYIRYFHPSDEAQQIDWDKFAIYGSDIVRKAKDDNALLASLRKLFLPLAPSVVIFKKGAHIRFNIGAITPGSMDGYHDISWQYSGLSMRLVNEFARQGKPTVRLNRRSAAVKVEKKLPDSLLSGSLLQMIPAPHPGGNFTLNAVMKVVSVDHAVANIGLTNISPSGQGSSSTIVTPSDANDHWKEYTVTGRIDKISSQIMLGVTLRGNGMVLVKDLHFTVKLDGKEYVIALDNQSFTRVDANGQPVAWNNPTADNGHYKFEVINEPSAVSGAALKISFKRELSKNNEVDSPLYDYKAKVGDVINKELVPGIQCMVPLALYGTADATYPSGDKAALGELIAALRHIKDTLVADSMDVRLGDIVIAWNIYRHFFPFWQDVGPTPEQLLREALIRSFKDKTPTDFYHTLELMTAPLKDGHLWVVMKGDSSYAAMAAVSFIEADGKIVIRDVSDPNLQATIRPGDVVDSMNGMTPRQLLKEINRYSAASPQRNLYTGLQKLSFGYPRTRIQMSLHRSASHYHVIINRNLWSFDGAASLVQKLPASGTVVADSIYYINLLESAAKVDSLIGVAAAAKAIIFDLRGYPIYDLFDIVLTHLITGTVSSPPILYDPQIIYPDFEKVKYTLSKLDVIPRSPHIKGKCYFLTDASIGSHPEYFMAYIKHYKLATIVGQSTAGIDGTINGFYLPGGYEMTFTGIRVDGLDGHHHLEGVVPDVIVNPTIVGVAAGKDEIFENALKMALHDTH